MLHLAYTAYQAWTHREEHKLLIVGAEGSGKTCLLEKTKAVFAPKGPGAKPVRVLKPSSITPTVGLNIARVDVGGKHTLLWDLGGHPSIRSLWANYYAQCHGVIFVVDATSPQRVREAASLLRALLCNPALAEAPVLIVAAKSDAEGALSAQGLLAALDLADLAVAAAAASASSSPLTGARQREGDGASLVSPSSNAATTHTTVAPPIPSWLTWEMSETLRGTSGIAGHAYRCVAASGYTGDGIREGLEWLAEFVALNPRAIETL